MVTSDALFIIIYFIIALEIDLKMISKLTRPSTGTIVYLQLSLPLACVVTKDKVTKGLTGAKVARA